MPDKKRPKSDTSKDISKRMRSEDMGSFNYDPVHFIRSHSKNNDPADIQTQIWEVRTMARSCGESCDVIIHCSGCLRARPQRCSQDHQSRRYLRRKLHLHHRCELWDSIDEVQTQRHQRKFLHSGLVSSPACSL